MTNYREFIVTVLAVFLLSVALTIADGTKVVLGANNTSASPAYPSEPLQAVSLDVYIDPAQNTITVPSGNITIQPTLRVAAEDQGEQVQLLMYINVYLPCFKKGFLLKGPMTNLNKTVCFDSFFSQPIDLSNLNGLIADIYYGYMLSNGKIKYSVYRLIVKKSNYSFYYQDADGDGYGDPNIFIISTSQPSGYVTNNADSNDADANVHP